MDLVDTSTEAPERTMRALALRREVGWEKSRLSHQISRMERRGLVLREDCAEDSRGAVVRLTDAGGAVIATACAEHAQAVRTHLIDRLTPDQLDALADISEAVLAGLAARDVDPIRTAIDT